LLVGFQEAYRVCEVLLGTGHGGDAHEGVVHSDAEVVDGHAGGAEEDKVSEGRLNVPPHGAADEIVDRDNLQGLGFRIHAAVNKIVDRNSLHMLGLGI
jgi:hypothetical protein